MDNFYYKNPAHFGDMFVVFEDFYRSNNLADVIIACDGKTLHAHRIVLSAGSDYFKKILLSIKQSNQFPILFINDIAYEDMETILEFIYRGQIIVTREKVESLRQAAHKLRIKGFEHFLRKPTNGSNGGQMDRYNNGHNGNMHLNNRHSNISNHSEKRRAQSFNDQFENQINNSFNYNSFQHKRMKPTHNNKDGLSFNRLKDDLKHQRSMVHFNVQPEGERNSFNKRHRFQFEQYMKQIQQIEAAKALVAKSAQSQNNRSNENESKSKSINQSTDGNAELQHDSVSITPIQNGKDDNNSPNGMNDSYDENEDNNRNENMENRIVDKNGFKNKLMNYNGAGSNVANGEDDCESDEAPDDSVNYTYEMDPNTLTWENSSHDENIPEANQETGAGSDEYCDEDDEYFEANGRTSNGVDSMAAMNQAHLLNKMNNNNNQYNPQGGLFYCEHCPKYFFDEDHLQLHNKRSHGLNKLNQCNICGKTYAWKSGLYKHKRHVHNITSNKALGTITVDNVKADSSSPNENGSGDDGGTESPISFAMKNMPNLPLPLTSSVSSLEATKMMDYVASKA